MLLEFQLENYLSFKDISKLSMLASSKSQNELPDSVANIGKYNVLKSAAIYGANASGKSNLLSAIHFMKKFILDSAKESQAGEEIPVKNFRLNSACDEKPSTFEITFIVRGFVWKDESKDVVFRYGFQVDKKSVRSEWLFARFTAQESRLFARLGDDIKIGEKYAEGKQVYNTVGKIRRTSLFLSMVAAIKGENAVITHAVIEWLQATRDISAMLDDNMMGVTADGMARKEVKELIMRAFAMADICVEDIHVEKKPVDLSKIPSSIKDDLKKNLNSEELRELYTFSIKSVHKKYNKDKEEVGLEVFDFEEEESDGSKKFFTLIGPVLAALKNGLILIVDEIDARLHPNLCEALIALFNSKEANMKNGQLIFATHNTLIMNKNHLRRDQVYLVEKDKYGESELYSLFDYKKVRNDASYDKDYLMGKYGAVPFLGNFESLVAERNNG